MSLAGLIPAPQEVLKAAQDTRLLLRVRARLIRGRKARMLSWVGFLFLLLAMVSISNIGSILVRFAEQTAGTDAAQSVITYVIALRSGEFGAIGAATLGSAVAAALFNPFTGAANQALVAADDLAALRPHRLHRYFDSLVTGAVSSIGALQLIALTAVASLLTLDGGRAGALLMTWLIWPILIMVASAEGWAIELIYRAYGAKVRRTIAASLVVVVGVAALLDPQHGKTLFGIGTAYNSALRAAAEGNLSGILATFAVLATIAVVAFIGGLVLCRAALEHPAVPSTGTKARKRRIPLSTRPRIALLQVLTSLVLRTAEIRRTLVALVFMGIPAAWFAGSTQQAVSSMVIAIPLATALVWGSNVFGIIGPGMTWLGAQPRTLRWLLPLTTLLQVGIIGVLAILCWLPPTLVGSLNLRDAAAVAAGLAVSTAVVSRSAISKSVHKPLLVKLGARGDVLIPPLRALNYTARFAIWGGLAGVLTVEQGDGWIQAALMLAAVCWSLIRYAFIARAWRDRNRQARIVATVAAA